MKTSLFAAAVSLVLALGALPDFADAKRLGGGKSFGMQRQAPAQPAPRTPAADPAATPAPTAPQAGKPATPAAAGTAAAAPARSSWLGPIAGLAAGLGLAALFSALGLGEAFGSFVLLLLLGVLAFVVIRMVLSRMRGSSSPALAGATAGAAPGGAPMPARYAAHHEPVQAGAPASATPVSADTQERSVTGAPLRPIRIGEALGAPAEAGAVAMAASSLPDGFDRAGFERVAKMIFIRLQAANDKGDLDDLREFTTPEVFAALRLDILERDGATQLTDVERVDADLVEFVEEAGRQVASVRFKGQVREAPDAPSADFDEIWHLVRPVEDGRSWAIAGIQQAH